MIYFISTEDDCIKIGHTIDIKKRLSDLQTDTPQNTPDSQVEEDGGG